MDRQAVKGDFESLLQVLQHGDPFAHGGAIAGPSRDVGEPFGDRCRSSRALCIVRG
jgi:hypothetical protein